MAAWTTYGMQQMLAASTGAIPLPTLWLALFSTSADPAGSPVELVIVGYQRQQLAFVGAGAGVVENASDVEFDGLAAGAFTGMQVLDDDVAGGAWMWADQGAPVTIPGPSSSVTFPATQISASL